MEILIEDNETKEPKQIITSYVNVRFWITVGPVKTSTRNQMLECVS